MKWTMFVVEKFGVAYEVTVYLEIPSGGWDAWCSATRTLKYALSTMEEVKELINNSLTGEKQNEMGKD